jgi:hypothetical protein
LLEIVTQEIPSMKILAAALAALLCACSTLPHRPTSQSFDQANLKRSDHGCPTAVFVAPHGDLVPCQQQPPAAPKDDTKYFPSANAAAIYAVTKIYERSHYYEYGGVIGKAPKGYVIGSPVTQHHGMDVSFSEDPEDYAYPIAATYHVHPCIKNAYPEVFSPQDLAGSRAANHPAYVLDECTGAVHYWAPGDGYLDADALLKMGVPPIALFEGVQLAAGKVVGTIAVDGARIN